MGVAVGSPAAGVTKVTAAAGTRDAEGGDAGGYTVGDVSAYGDVNSQ